MKLSIIVAAYNIQEYIGNCLNSIFQQEAPQDMYEVLVVNDGSSDNTLDIIRSFEDGHHNMVIIDQENRGLSAARNAGLKRVTGDYVLFVDGDDALTENSIQTISSYCLKYPNADFLTFDRIHVNLRDNTEEYCCSFGKKHFGINKKKNNNLYLRPLDRETVNSRIVSGVVWLNIYKTLFLRQNELFFLEGILHEDDEFRLKSFFFTKEMRFIPFAHYRYSALRPGSITTESQIPKQKSVDSWIKILESWSVFEKEHTRNKADVRFVNSLKYYMYSRLLKLSLLPKDNELYNFYVSNKKTWRDNFRKSFVKSISFNSFFFVRLVRFFLTLHCPQFLKYTEIKVLKEFVNSIK